MRSLTMALIALVGIVPYTFAQFVYDNFDGGHTIGSTPEGWSVKWEDATNDPPLQANLWTVQEGVGVNGSNALELDVTQAEQNYHAKLGQGVAGSKVTMSVDVQFGVSDVPLTGGATNGVNGGFIGLIISTNENWFTGPNVGIAMCRRNGAAGNIWGVSNLPHGPPWTKGWVGIGTIGLSDGLSATSDWFTIEMVMTDTGTRWEYVESWYYPAGSDNVLYTSSQDDDLDANMWVDYADIPAGATLYGGVSSMFNGKATPPLPLSDIIKLSMLRVDNFVMGSESATVVDSFAFEDVTAYEFQSEPGKMHRLQYSLNGTDFFNTGAMVAGDGSVMSLIDPAPSTVGRTYRVTSD